MFKVNNKATKTMPMASLYCTPCSSVSIVNFEQVNAGWVARIKDFPQLKVLKKLTNDCWNF